MRHRKLFPTSTTNQSVVCPDICDSSCPYDCYPYSDTYFVPPPLPPPPPPGPPVAIKHGLNISPYVIIIATLVVIAFIIFSYYLVIVKNCFRPRRRQEEGAEENFLDENHGPGIDHPIWYIRTVGLQASIINSITVFKYKKGDSLVEGTDCSVCLNEFQDDEILRLLPKCNHAFHIPCIDTWLRSHTNCPVCRAGVVSTTVTTPVAAQNAFNGDSLSPSEANRVEIAEASAGNGDGEREENRTGIVDEVGFPEDDVEVQAEMTKRVVNYDENAASWVSDCSDESSAEQDEIKQVKRSFSADSLVIGKIRLAMVDLPITGIGLSLVDRGGDPHICETREQNGLKTSIHERNNDAAIAQPSQQRIFPVKRSFSYGGRSFFSRDSRSSHSILPL